MSRYQSEDDTELNVRCYNEGKSARNHTNPVDKNPYLYGSDEWGAWEMGWYDEDSFLRGYLV